MTKKITALEADGGAIAQMSVTYEDPALDGSGGPTFLLDRVHAAWDAGGPAVNGEDALRARGNLTLTDAFPVNDPVTWPIPHRALRRGEVFPKLGAALVQLFFAPIEGDAIFERGGKATVRYAGIAARPYGRTRAFDAKVDLSTGGMGMCHSWSNDFQAAGTLYFAEEENVLLEAELSGNAVNFNGTCQGCGKDGSRPCPPTRCPLGKGRFSLRVACTPSGKDAGAH
jgi:hypothetical protein